MRLIPRLTGGCCSPPRLPAASASPGTEFRARTLGKRALLSRETKRQYPFGICVPGFAVPLTSLGDGADVLLDFLALGGHCGGRKRQLGVDVVRDGGDRGAQVRVTQVSGGELRHNILFSCFNFNILQIVTYCMAIEASR